MIKVKHPLEHCNISQEQYLSICPVEDRRYHELLFTYGNAVYQYHHEAKEFNPTEEDFKEWLAGLPDNISRDMEQKGFEACKGVLSFTRYVNEKNDIGMDEYVQQRMGLEDYAEYQSLLNKG